MRDDSELAVTAAAKAAPDAASGQRGQARLGRTGRAITRRSAIVALAAVACALSCELLVPAELTCPPSFVCAPPAPSGWTGPLILYHGTPPAPVCPASMPAQVARGGFDLDAGPAQCVCSCSPPEGETCGKVTLTAALSDCKSACLTPTTVELKNGQCTSLTAFTCFGDAGRASSASLSAEPAAGRCTAAQERNVPPPAWGGSAVACAGSDLGSCPGGGACVPPPPAGFAPQPCIAQRGELLCPAGPYSASRIVYGDVRDDRTCSPCHCDVAGGTTCSVALNTHVGTTACAGSSIAATGPGCLVDAGLDFRNIDHVEAFFEAGGGSCAPDGGVPTGHAAPATPTTVCCMQ